MGKFIVRVILLCGKRTFTKGAVVLIPKNVDVVNIIRNFISPFQIFFLLGYLTTKALPGARGHVSSPNIDEFRGWGNLSNRDDGK